MNNIKEKLGGCDLEAFQTICTELNTSIKKACKKGTNPLAEYFDCHSSLESLTELPELDRAFQLHRNNLSNDTLIKIFEFSFTNISVDNYLVAVDVVREITTRRDVDTQLAVVKNFIKAGRYYDFGHREHSNTVYDKLIDELFPDFECDSLIKILRIGHTDFLNSQNGDEAENLFPCAFKKCTTDKQFSGLSKLYQKYIEEIVYSFDDKYIQELEEKILNAITEVYKGELLAFIEKMNNKLRLDFLLKDGSLGSVVEIINSLDTPEGKKFFKKEEQSLFDKSVLVELPSEAYNRLIDIGIKRNAFYHTLSKVILKYVYGGSVDNIISLFDQYLSPKNKEVLCLLRREILNELNKVYVDVTETKKLRDFFVTHFDESLKNIYEDEIQSLFIEYEHNDLALKQISKIAQVVEPEISAETFKLNYLLDKLMCNGDQKSWEEVRTICQVLYPILDKNERWISASLHFAISASMVLNDKEYFLDLDRYLPKDKTKNSLLFFQAKASSLYNKKEKLLFYTQKAIELGVSPVEFTICDDFENYRADDDFLKLLESLG